MSTQQCIITTVIVGIALAICLFAWDTTVANTLKYQSSSTDWCEENYATSEWIVEFWNTISSFMLCAFGVLGLVVYRNDPKLYMFEPATYLIWAMMIVVGLGSVWFHSTLSVAGQVFDAVPIIILCLLIIAMSRANDTPFRSTLLNAHSVLRGTVSLLCLCLFFPIVSHVITIILLPVGIVVFIRDYRLLTSDHPLFCRMFWFTNAFFYLAVAVWIVDCAACEPVTKWGMEWLGFYPQLHAVWHVLIGITFWLVVCLFIMMKAWRERELKPALKSCQFFVVQIDDGICVEAEEEKEPNVEEDNNELELV